MIPAQAPELRGGGGDGPGSMIDGVRMVFFLWSPSPSSGGHKVVAVWCNGHPSARIERSDGIGVNRVGLTVPNFVSSPVPDGEVAPSAVHGVERPAVGLQRSGKCFHRRVGLGREISSPQRASAPVEILVGIGGMPEDFIRGYSDGLSTVGHRSRRTVQNADGTLRPARIKAIGAVGIAPVMGIGVVFAPVRTDVRQSPDGAPEDRIDVGTA